MMNKNISILHVMLLLGAAAHSHAQQNVEAEWRVINDEPEAVVPVYADGPNPFPMKKIPESKIVKKNDDEQEQKKMEKASLLAEARKIISGNSAFAPNIKGLEFKGYLNGHAGEMVLLKGKWLKIGESLTVPVEGGRDAMNMIVQLEMLDAGLAESVRQELMERMSSKGGTSLKIKRIEKKQVIVEDASHEFAIPLRHEDL